MVECLIPYTSQVSYNNNKILLPCLLTISQDDFNIVSTDNKCKNFSIKVLCLNCCSLRSLSKIGKLLGLINETDADIIIDNSFKSAEISS